MSWLNSFFGSDDTVSKVTDSVGNSLDKLFTSDEERLTIQEARERIEAHKYEIFNNITAAQANSPFWFVAAARPFCVWISGLNFAQVSVAVVWFNKQIPEWYADASITALLASLGIYGLLRTAEKIKGKANGS